MEGFTFKTVVMGTSDNLKAEFISLISQRSWAVDGVSGHVFKHNQIAMDIWFPKENASSKVLISFSYRDVNGVILVIGRRDRRVLNRFKRKMRKEIGLVPWVGIVLRKNMSEAEKAVKCLHSIKILCDKMRDIALESDVKPLIKEEKGPPQAVAGQPIYKVDEFGFIVPDSDTGIPLFVEESTRPPESTGTYTTRFEESGDENICLICRASIYGSSNTQRCDECGNIFHSNCLLKWVEEGHKMCPHCSALIRWIG